MAKTWPGRWGTVANQPTSSNTHTHTRRHSKPQRGSTNWTVGGDRCWALVISRCYLAHKFVLQWFLRLLHFYLFFFFIFFSLCLSCCCCLRFDLFEHPAQKFPALNYWSWRFSDLWPWIGLVTGLRNGDHGAGGGRGIGAVGMLVIWSSYQIDWLLAIYLPCWLWLCQNMCDMWNNEFVVVSAYCAFIYYINIVFKGFSFLAINPNCWVDKVRFFLQLA